MFPIEDIKAPSRASTDQRRKQDNDADDSQKRADEHAAPCPRAENKPGKDDVHPEHR
jgi:hypothetical protein